MRDFAERAPFTQDDLNLAEQQTLHACDSMDYLYPVLEIMRIRRQVPYSSGILNEGFAADQQAGVPASRQHAAEERGQSVSGVAADPARRPPSIVSSAPVM